MAGDYHPQGDLDGRARSSATVGGTRPGGQEMSTKCCYHRRYKRGQLASRVQVPKKSLRVWLDFGSSVAIILELLLVPDTALALVSSVSSVYIWNTYAPHMAVNLNWTAVSFLLAFPLQNAIREAYRRRESALQALMNFRATLMAVYLANAVWDWPGAEGYEGRWEDNVAKDAGGRGKKKKPCDRPLSTTHGEQVKDLTFRILDALQDMLFVPRAGHARNEFPCGRVEQQEIDQACLMGRETVLLLIGRLQQATEELKAAGMPANEASRINQYNMFLIRDFEHLWAFKTYTTPIALRAVLRVLIQVLPFFYGPYWLHIANGGVGTHTHKSLLFACLFSTMLTLLFIAMTNVQEQVENPFRNNNRDTIKIKFEINLCRKAIKAYSEDLESRWHERMLFEWEFVGDDGHVGDRGDNEEDDSDASDVSTSSKS